MFTLLCIPLLAAGGPPGVEQWRPPSPASIARSRPAGPLAARLDRSLSRLRQAPFTLPFILADVSFSEKRIFTEYSGDISGRVLGVSAREARCGRKPTWSIRDLVDGLSRYQKPDGHYGADQNLKDSIVGERDTPILWGNGRLLIALVDTFEATRDAKALAMARALGDYYLETDTLLNRSELVDRFGNYAAGFATCYFSGMEGLVALSRATKDTRYRDQAERMARLMSETTAPKEQHSHGRLCALRGLLDLYEATGKRAYLDRVVSEHDVIVRQFLWPTGGISEMSSRTNRRNEGCSEADWLRLNLQLWRLTGRDRYLDYADLVLANELSANQFANGGFGHRVTLVRDGRMDGYQPASFEGTQEAYWCCSEHGPRALLEVASSVCAVRGRDVYVNLYEPAAAEVHVSGRPVVLRVEPAGLGERVTISVSTERPAKFALRLRVPTWCRDFRVDGKPARRQNGRVVIDRRWRNGDRISVRMAFAAHYRRDGDPAYLDRTGSQGPVAGAAIYYGPHLLVFPLSGAPAAAEPSLSLSVLEKEIPGGRGVTPDRGDGKAVDALPLARLPAEAGFQCRASVRP